MKRTQVNSALFKCVPIIAISKIRIWKKWTHWGLNPGPSACEADVIPLHHEPYDQCQKQIHWHQKQQIPASMFLQNCDSSDGSWGICQISDSWFWIWSIVKWYIITSGVAQWLACWAHNPKVRGSKPRSAIFQSLHHFEQCILFKHTSIPIDNNKNTCSQSPIQLPDLRSRSTLGHRVCFRVLLFCFNVWSGTCGIPPFSFVASLHLNSLDPGQVHLLDAIPAMLPLPRILELHVAVSSSRWIQSKHWRCHSHSGATRNLILWWQQYTAMRCELCIKNQLNWKLSSPIMLIYSRFLEMYQNAQHVNPTRMLPKPR